MDPESTQLVSVIIPTYNRARLLGRAITSVLNQSLQVHEVLVVDDGSSDDTRRVVSEFAAADPRVKYYFQARAGAPAARNRGIGLAEGKLIAFQDSDDLWLPHFLRELAAARTTRNSVSFCSLESVSTQGTSKIVHPHLIENVNDQLIRGNCISTQCALVPAHLLRQHKFDEALPRLQDWDLWLSMIGTAKFVHHPKPLAVQFLQPDSITKGSVTLDRAVLIISKKHWRVLGRRPANFLRLLIPVTARSCWRWVSSRSLSPVRRG